MNLDKAVEIFGNPGARTWFVALVVLYVLMTAALLISIYACDLPHERAL